VGGKLPSNVAGPLRDLLTALGLLERELEIIAAESKVSATPIVSGRDCRGRGAAVYLGNRRYQAGDSSPIVLQESEDTYCDHS